jgi:hypothetical protein
MKTVQQVGFMAPLFISFIGEVQWRIEADG